MERKGKKETTRPERKRLWENAVKLFGGAFKGSESNILLGVCRGGTIRPCRFLGATKKSEEG